jgi:hypothetical protein
MKKVNWSTRREVIGFDAGSSSAASALIIAVLCFVTDNGFIVLFDWLVSSQFGTS